LRKGFVSIAFFILISLPVRGGEFQDDLRARRQRIMDRLGPEAMLIVWSAPVQIYSRDVDYEYRQDSNFYYLTGIDQEETILVLMPGNATRKEILFIKPRDPVREHWQGRLLSKEEATAQSGIGHVYLGGEFESFVSEIFAQRSYGVDRYAASSEFKTFFNALGSGKARLALVLDPRPQLSRRLSPNLEFANQLKERFVGFSVQDATGLFRDLRGIKTPYEQKILERSVAISCDAHIAGMKAARPGGYEYEVEAAIEHVYKSKGALGWGYPSIVASGPNATILHYNKSTRKMEGNDLLLVDAAASYEYLTGDITRTYPVGGAFTPTQKEIYRVVLSAQEEGIKLARAGKKLTEIHQKTVEVIKEGLLRLGLITDASSDQYRTWYTHGACHYIGMDVHDVGDNDWPLQPGMAFVIEPGIYVREGALENLPKTPANAAFIEKVRPAFEKYKNIGVRIEDSFLLTESGLKNLSARVPKTIEEVEKAVGASSKP
jgi:Xaa-Pro aminopeptidase